MRLNLPKSRTVLYALLGGLAIRLLLAPLSGHPWDLFVWYDTAGRIGTGGVLYGSESLGGYAYPPGWAAFLFVVHAVYSPLAAYIGVQPMGAAAAGILLGVTVNLGTNLVVDWLFALLVKLPLIGFDTVLAFTLYKTVQNHAGDSRLSERAFLLFYLNPYVIFISSVWGMFDVIPAYFAFLGVLSWMQGRGYVAGASFAFGALMKYFPALILLCLICGYWKGRDRRARKALLSFVAVFLAVSLPFLVQGWAGYVSGVSSPLNPLYLGNLSIWLVAPYLGVAEIPGWLAISDILVILLLAGVFSWTFGRHATPSDQLGLPLDVTAVALLLTYVLSRTVNEQYFIWLLPFLTLDIVLRGERLPFLAAMSGLAIGHSWLNLSGSSFFLPLVTISAEWSRLAPWTLDVPVLRAAIGLTFWATSLILLRNRLGRVGGTRNMLRLLALGLRSALRRLRPS